MENVESWTGKFIENSTEAEGLANKFTKNDILFGKLRPYLAKVALAKQNGICSTEFLVYRSTSAIDAKFYRYLLVSTAFINLISSSTYGTKMPRASSDFLGIQRLPILPLPEQTAIAAFLDRKTALIDRAVAIKEKQIALLKERKQIMIQNAVTRGLNPDVSMRDSGVEWIGEIPGHWEIKSIRYAFDFLNYRRLPLSAVERETKQGKYPYYGASGIIDYIDDYIFDEPLILIAEDGANLLSKSTPLAFVATGKYWVNNHAHIIKPKLPGFTYWAELLSSLDYTIYISGAAQPKLTRDRLASIRIPIPTSEDIQEIIDFIETQSAKIDRAIAIQQRQIEKLKEYKATLINSAVTGKIKVVSGELSVVNSQLTTEN